MISHSYENIEGGISIAENNISDFDLNDNQKLMTESAWTLKYDKMKLSKPPEALFIDTTLKSNNKNCPLLLVFGKDENTKYVIATRV